MSKKAGQHGVAFHGLVIGVVMVAVLALAGLYVSRHHTKDLKLPTQPTINSDAPYKVPPQPTSGYKLLFTTKNFLGQPEKIYYTTKTLAEVRADVNKLCGHQDLRIWDYTPVMGTPQGKYKTPTIYCDDKADLNSFTYEIQYSRDIKLQDWSSAKRAKLSSIKPSNFLIITVSNTNTRTINGSSQN